MCKNSSEIKLSPSMVTFYLIMTNGYKLFCLVLPWLSLREKEQGNLTVLPLWAMKNIAGKPIIITENFTIEINNWVLQVHFPPEPIALNVQTRAFCSYERRPSWCLTFVWISVYFLRFLVWDHYFLFYFLV